MQKCITSRSTGSQKLRTARATPGSCVLNVKFHEVELIAKKFLSENYECSGYLSKFEDGYYHSESFLQLVLPVSEATINSDHQHLVIGNAGSGGIEFCFRFQKSGIWTFYPIEEKYQKVAADVEELIEGWRNGSIEV